MFHFGIPQNRSIQIISLSILFFQQLFIANILFFGILLSVEGKKSLSKVNYFLLKNEQEINFKRKITLLCFL